MDILVKGGLKNPGQMSKRFGPPGPGGPRPAPPGFPKKGDSGFVFGGGGLGNFVPLLAPNRGGMGKRGLHGGRFFGVKFTPQSKIYF